MMDFFLTYSWTGVLTVILIVTTIPFIVLCLASLSEVEFFIIITFALNVLLRAIYCLYFVWLVTQWASMNPSYMDTLLLFVALFVLFIKVSYKNFKSSPV